MNVARAFSFLLSFRLLVLVLSSHVSPVITDQEIFLTCENMEKVISTKLKPSYSQEKICSLFQLPVHQKKVRSILFFLSVACYSNNVTYQSSGAGTGGAGGALASPKFWILLVKSIN